MILNPKSLIDSIIESRDTIVHLLDRELYTCAKPKIATTSVTSFVKSVWRFSHFN